MGATPGTDTWVAQISADDGQTWVDIERTMQSSDDWIPLVFNVRDYVTPSATVRLRFLASDLGPGSLVEAAIDDVEFLDIDPTLNGAETSPIPAGLRLAQSYPNPVAAGSSAEISYAIPSRMQVTLSLYDPLGRKIRTLVSAEEDPGAHAVRFDATDLVSGVYMYELLAGNSRLVGRMSVIR
jgi:hypothetical protein